MNRLISQLPLGVSPPRAIGRGGRAVGMVFLVFGLAVLGCAGAPDTKPTGGGGNFFRAAGALSADVQRVLLLPLTCEPQRADLVAGCEALELVLQGEVAKTRKFEVVKATATTLRAKTGRAAWGAEAALPPRFFESLREAYGCDAVLFCHLTEFKAYAPLAVGWRLRLVDARSQQTIWASDEVFDAARSEVQAGVQKFERRPGRWLPVGKPEDWLAMHSPRRFGEFALGCVLATLPER